MFVYFAAADLSFGLLKTERERIQTAGTTSNVLVLQINEPSGNEFSPIINSES